MSQSHCSQEISGLTSLSFLTVLFKYIVIFLFCVPSFTTDLSFSEEDLSRK
jgi:hypothetical protein